MAIEPAGFSQPQGISPDGGIVQPAVVAEGLVAVPPPLFGAQAQQSPDRAPLGEHDLLGSQRQAGSAQGPTPISHDEGPRLLPSQDDGVSAFSDVFGYVGLQGTRPHQGPLTNRDRKVEMPEAFDASRGLNVQGHSAVSYTHLTLPTILLV